MRSHHGEFLNPERASFRRAWISLIDFKWPVDTGKVVEVLSSRQYPPRAFLPILAVAVLVLALTFCHPAFSGDSAMSEIFINDPLISVIVSHEHDSFFPYNAISVFSLFCLQFNLIYRHKSVQPRDTCPFCGHDLRLNCSLALHTHQPDRFNLRIGRLNTPSELITSVKSIQFSPVLYNGHQFYRITNVKNGRGSSFASSSTPETSQAGLVL